jgi:hypothetical protein
VFDPSKELKQARGSEVLGFKLLDITIPDEFKDNDLNALSEFSAEIVRFIAALLFVQASELGIDELKGSCACNIPPVAARFWFTL